MLHNLLSTHSLLLLVSLGLCKEKGFSPLGDPKKRETGKKKGNRDTHTLYTYPSISLVTDVPNSIAIANSLGR